MLLCPDIKGSRLPLSYYYYLLHAASNPLLLAYSSGTRAMPAVLHVGLYI
jgi:hypothetical protein